nr:capsid protein [Tick-associated circular DNA virus]
MAPYKKTYKPRRRYAKKSTKASPMKKQVRSIVRTELKKNVEVKYVEQHSNEKTLNVLGSALVINMSNIDEGTGPFQRIGKKVRCIGLHVKGIVNNNFAQTNFVRFALLQSKDQNPIDTTKLLFSSKGPTTGDATLPDLSGGYAGGTILSGLDTIYYKLSDAKVNVLKQWVIRIGAGNDPSGKGAIMYNHFVKRKMDMIYNDTTGTSALKPIYLVIWTADANDDGPVGALVEVNQLATTYYTDA